MIGRLVRGMLVTLALSGLLAVGVPVALAQSGADLAIGIEADRTTAKAGQTVTYTITVSNVGDATATDVALFVGCFDNLQCVSLGAVPETLEAGATVTATLVAIANPCGLSITRDATVVAEVSSTSPDSDPSNNRDSVTIRLQKCHQR
jgi:subtilase family serine protease